MTPSEETIRAMDGPRLTKLAWALGLDPHDRTGRRCFSWQQRSWGEAAIDAHGTIWRPHERLDQADAVFRGLRTREWSTLVWCDEGEAGGCEARRMLPIGIRKYVSVGIGPHEDPEALALLRCAVLARASEEA